VQYGVLLFGMHGLLLKIRNYTKSVFIWPSLFVFIIIVGSISVDVNNKKSERTIEVGNESGWGFGGPVRVASASLYEAMGTVGSGDSLSAPMHHLDSPYIKISSDASVRGISSPVSNILRDRNGIITYKVQEGDTLSEIGARFGISLETIRWANPGTRSFIRIGTEITIPPVNGVVYEVEEGDSLESVASVYNISPEAIKEYNPEHQKLFENPDAIVILPNARPSSYSYSKTNTQNLPLIRSYFALPARGFNWGKLHHNNAIDIADECGSPIYASAEGLVIESSDKGFWNQGYGNFVEIEHPNGTITKYAHTKENTVSVGDYTSQGDIIALIGNSGKTYGASGCHLHFEVEGAQNPFTIR
jgi:murein DD-endopeptidase MepM/ murein hydrolase activator NlpD